MRVQSKIKATFILLVLLMLQGTMCQAQTQAEADSLHQRGRELMNEGNIAEGRECTRQAMEIRKKLLGEVSEDYITSLNNYALSFGIENNWKKAVELQEQVMELCGKLKQPHKNIGMYTTNMGRFYYRTGNREKAVKMWEQALPLVEKYDEIYDYLLTNLGAIYDESGSQKDRSRIMALVEEMQQYKLTQPCDEPQCMLERAEYYASKGNNGMAKECYLKVLAMSMDGEMKVKVYESYGNYLSNNARDFASGADYLLSAANQRKSVSGENESYANLMYMSAMTAFIGKKYEQSIESYQKVVDFYKKYDSTAALNNIAKCMKGMGNAYSGLKEFDKAIECFQQAVNHYERHDQANEEYPKAVLRLAKAEKFNKDYPASIEHHKQAMELFKLRGMTNEYADAVTSLKLCYAYAGMDMPLEEETDEINDARMSKIDEIILSELKDLEMVHTYLGKLAYTHSLATLGGAYMMKEDWDNSVKYYQMYVDTLRDAIRDEFRLQSEAERMLIWNDDRRSVSEMMELLLELPEGKEALAKKVAGMAYDAELLSKGILLNSAIEFEKVLADKGDSKLTDAYEQSKANERELEYLRQNAETEDDLNRILQLTRQNQSLQLDLMRGCAEYADFTNYISYTWRNVQASMTDKDVAIEFAAVGDAVFEESRMMALVLTKNMESPVAVTVCGLKELQGMERSADLYVSPAAGKVIWGTLSQYLTGKKRVFFSADDALNRIGIEYLLYNNEPLSEQFEVYRLSSTKELCYSRKQGKPDKAILFGDINYNDEATVSDATKRSLSNVRGAGETTSFADLSNTLREITEIQKILKQHGIKHTEQLRDTEASRSAFLNLTDSKINVLHIATHGVYVDNKRSTDADAMSNSVLAFAGANVCDDGLVSAADVADMNLRQCDLAVLSACETGLGKLGDDGVFGLQRGFKNAGVHTLLMSLKNVYDESTAELMISFYRQLTTGATKREALIKAQREIREKGYDDPKYWATFILLDAL